MEVGFGSALVQRWSSVTWLGSHLWELGIRMAPSSPIQPVFPSRKVRMRPPILLSASRTVT